MKPVWFWPTAKGKHPTGPDFTVALSMCLVNRHFERRNKGLCQFLPTSYPCKVLPSIKNASILFSLLASPNTRDCSAIVSPEAQLGTGLQHGRKTSLSLPGHSFFASAWGGKVGDAWGASGKGPAELARLFQEQGGNQRAEGSSRGSSSAVFRAPAVGSFRFLLH